MYTYLVRQKTANDKFQQPNISDGSGFLWTKN